jgi:hypothetical protein
MTDFLLQMPDFLAEFAQVIEADERDSHEVHRIDLAIAVMSSAAIIAASQVFLKPHM